MIKKLNSFFIFRQLLLMILFYNIIIVGDKMKIGIASDHHGLDKIEEITKFLEKNGYEVENYCPNESDSTDYPKYAFTVSNAVVEGKVDRGILMCGTGIGMSIAANKVKGIRCARIASVEDAALSAEHNHANVIAFSAHLPMDLIKEMILTYLNKEPSQEERHVRRVNMIDEYNG